jgi:ComF family protein
MNGEGCDMCAAPLIGEVQSGDLCDACLTAPRPWARAAALMLYRGNAKSIVMRLKHADRTDLAYPVGGWLAKAAEPLIEHDTVVVPVPIHWWRGYRRRYNQSILLSNRVSTVLNTDHCPNLLKRKKATRKLDGMSAAERKKVVAGAISFRQRKAKTIAGRHVLLIDDVLTTGATLTECTNACLAAGARKVSVAVLARVAKKN